MPTPVQLDFSKAQPINQGGGGVTLDFSNAQPIAQSPPAPSMTATPPPSMLQQGMSALGNFGKGIAKSGISLMSTGDEAVRKIPGIGEWLTTPANGTPADQAIAHVHQMATPHGTAQNLGYGAGEAAQFLIPGGAEEEGAAKLATIAPKLGKFAKPIAKAITSAVGSGAVNTLQGGSPLTGAAMGAGGSLAGDVLKAAAPAVTEFAQGIHTPGAKTGKAILAETGGVMPGSIRSSARGVLDELNPQLDQAAIDAGQDAQGNLVNPVSLAPARQTAQQFITKAIGQGEPKFYKGTQRLAKQLDVLPNGTPLPEDVTPYQALLTKRGVGNAVSAAKWKPGYNDPFTGAQKAVYGQLNHAFEGAVPEAAPLNARISALIPATKPGATSFSRYVSPAVGTMMGGYTGAMRGLQSGEQGEPNLEKAFTGGITGAALGGLTGYAAPTAMNVFARTANSPALQKFLIPAATGAALQVDRKKKEQ
jgi:hypothetical protein